MNLLRVLIIIILTWFLVSCGSNDAFYYRYCNNVHGKQISCENGQEIP